MVVGRIAADDLARIIAQHLTERRSIQQQQEAAQEQAIREREMSLRERAFESDEETRRAPKEQKRHIVTSIGSRGEPVQKLVSEDDPMFAEGIPQYREPKEPKPTPEPKRHVVTSIGKRGEPVQRLVSEDDPAFAEGIPQYREPKTTAQPRDERLVQVAGPNGSAIWVHESDAVGKPAAQAARSITGQERSVLGFFNRMLEAERNARAVEDKLTGRDVAASEYAPGWLENFLKTPEGQQYTQAQRMYTEARLRKESGAAIPPHEYEADRRTNFRVAGDQPGAMKNKRRARVQTMRGIGNAAGRALAEFYGEGTTLNDLLKEFDDAREPVSPGSGKRFTIIGVK